jgi:hypothetical protein
VGRTSERNTETERRAAGVGGTRGEVSRSGAAAFDPYHRRGEIAGRDKDGYLAQDTAKRQRKVRSELSEAPGREPDGSLWRHHCGRAPEQLWRTALLCRADTSDVM